MKISERLLIFISLLILLSTTAQAEEIIRSFKSDIQINADASLTVTETITVQAEGQQIKRGIYRDFPTRYKDPYGNNYVVEFHVLDVLRDGKPEDWHSKNISNGVRVYMGNKNRLLAPGEYTYTLSYYTTRQLGFFKQYDELYWNVTGNGWAFPIEYASADVQLPPGVNIEQTQSDAYTGISGARGKDFEVSTVNNNRLLFESTGTLSPGEGLTIVVDWPKGFVTEPTANQKRQWFIQDNKNLLVGLGGLSLLWLYFFLVWNKVGRDPQKGVIYPRYQPPKGHSPASIRFVSNMGYDNKTFATALVSMAVKGFIKIEDAKNKEFIIHKTEQSVQADIDAQSTNQPDTLNRLSSGEAVINRDIFAEGNSITLKQSNHKLIGKAKDSHKKVLKQDYEKKYFKTNLLYQLPGLLISLITLLLTIYSIDSDAERELSGFLILWLSFWSIGTLVLSYRAFTLWRSIQQFYEVIPAVFMTLFAAPFVAAELFVLYQLWESSGTGLLLVFVLVILTHVFFYQWMKAPTLLGRKLLDKIEGFKLYLSVAEKEELQFKHRPEKTPELFERYLPYALALDVETQWSRRFSRVFSKLEQSDPQYRPRWYNGYYWNAANLAGFSSAMGDSLGSAIAASSSAPGSSSGGGGGSSGGGGGGGGGGGW